MKVIDRIKKNKNLMRFIETTRTRIADSEMGSTSVVVAYYLLLSIFPLLIAVGNILPFLRLDPQAVLTYVREIIPAAVYQFLGPAIQDLLTRGSGSLLSVSALAALWSASQSINALQIAMNKAYGVDQRGNFIVVRLVSLVVIVLFLVAIVGVTVVLGLGQMILEWLQPIFHLSDEVINVFQTLKWPVSLLVLLAIMYVIYLIVPNVKLKLKTIIPGTVFATIGWLLLSQVFGIYAKYFAANVGGYQIIGSFIVLMLWLNLAATIIILGGVINAVVQEYVTEEKVKERHDLISKWIAKIKSKFSNKKT